MKLNLDNKTIDYLTQTISIMKALRLDSLVAKTSEFDSTITYIFDYKNKWVKIEHVAEIENIDIEKGVIDCSDIPCVDHYQIKGKKLIYEKTEKLDIN